MIIRTVHERDRHEDFQIGVEAEELMYPSFQKDVAQGVFNYTQYVSTVRSIALSGYRVEGYLWTDEGLLIGSVIMSRCVDIHYGLVATPIVCIVKPSFRGKREVARALAALTKDVVRKLKCEKYYTVKHLSKTKQLHTLRTL